MHIYIYIYIYINKVTELKRFILILIVTASSSASAEEPSDEDLLAAATCIDVPGEHNLLFSGFKCVVEFKNTMTLYIT